MALLLLSGFLQNRAPPKHPVLQRGCSMTSTNQGSGLPPCSMETPNFRSRLGIPSAQRHGADEGGFFFRKLGLLAMENGGFSYKKWWRMGCWVFFCGWWMMVKQCHKAAISVEGFMPVIGDGLWLLLCSHYSGLTLRWTNSLRTGKSLRWRPVFCRENGELSS